jgi:hypothetical protein
MKGHSGSSSRESRPMAQAVLAGAVERAAEDRSASGPIIRPPVFTNSVRFVSPSISRQSS